MQGIRDASNDEKPLVGQKVNELKSKYLATFDKKIKDIEHQLLQQQLIKQSIDITLPGNRPNIGVEHPLRRAEGAGFNL